MAVLFIEYPKCSTCKKAKKWLEGRGVAFEERDVVAQNPTADELRAWREQSGLPLRRFFNTSGMLYRELGVTQRIVDGVPATPGFREAEWAEALGGGRAASAPDAAS